MAELGCSFLKLLLDLAHVKQGVLEQAVPLRDLHLEPLDLSALLVLGLKIEQQVSLAQRKLEDLLVLILHLHLQLLDLVHHLQVNDITTLLSLLHFLLISEANVGQGSGPARGEERASRTHEGRLAFRVLLL